MRSNETAGASRIARATVDRGRSRHSMLVRASMLALLVGAITLTACGGGGGGEQVASSLTPPPDNTNTEIDEADMPGAGALEPTLINVSTYEGSGQAVHPDAVVFPDLWRGRKYWVSATPYPLGNAKFENPSIYHGYRARQMWVPAGVTNPLAMPGALGGYLSDPDMLYDPDRDELRMYYRQTTTSADLLFLMTSGDGVRWSDPKRVFTGEKWGLISPAVVREDASSWRMWSVSATKSGCNAFASEVEVNQRRSTDGLAWGPPEPVNLVVPGRVPWHFDVQYVPAKKEYWALIAAYPDMSTCSKTAIFFARSIDGITWSVAPTPLLGPYEFAPMNDLVYRSTFHYHEASDAVTVWYSGARVGDGGFHMAMASARYPYADLIRRVSGSSPTLMQSDRMEEVSPELRAARTAFERDFP
jgi:hypothetical protein